MQFTLYGREDCHLCETMRDELRALQGQYDFSLHWVDVDSSPALAEQYGFYVPVLMHEGQMLCHYHLNRAAFIKIVAG